MKKVLYGKIVKNQEKPKDSNLLEKASKKALRVLNQ